MPPPAILMDIWSFIAADSETAATAFINAIERRFEPLLEHPELGPRREELAPGLRVAFRRRYAIYYLADERTVTIVRVVHGARDTRAFFGEESQA